MHICFTCEKELKLEKHKKVESYSRVQSNVYYKQTIPHGLVISERNGIHATNWNIKIQWFS